MTEKEDGVKVTSSTGKVNLIREGKLCTVKNVKPGEVLVCQKIKCSFLQTKAILYIE